ncbi:hypothetical protein [Ruficoccus sp. ZRK36]|uniref:hypothetical protein n=1 Tax=Ruficoccus sp. ZRK36 TaxID=2866311 RepID=UPI001C730831|nr:hypothetical protein [Ruficoccus sp. ZRK36]QYY34634.1 hypothetical protein K0V07_09995 [Ruficoccus sp. ZRK36]
MKKNLFLLSLISSVAAGSAFGITVVDENIPGIIKNSDNSYSITGDVTLSYTGDADHTYILENYTFVANGGSLTIEPGVIMRGQPAVYDGEGEVVSEPGSLVVSRGGQICADGTAENPIIFTTAANTNRERWSTGQSFLDANPATFPLPPMSGSGANQVDNVSLWGAVTLLGYAPINTSKYETGTSGESYIEGFGPHYEDERTLYGGRNTTDSSGVLRYVSIRHTSIAYEQNEEQQGLTLGGVGSGTILQYIDVYCSDSDGIEILGGTAELSHLMISYVNDDSLALDQGYTGTIQFAFVLGSDLEPDIRSYATGLWSDNLGEWEGDDDNSEEDYNVSATGAPYAHPALYNLTFMGPRGGSATLSNMIRARQSFGGDVRNSIFINAPASHASFRIDGTATDNTTNPRSTIGLIEWDYPSVNPRTQAEVGTLTFAGTMWYNVSNNTAATVGVDSWAIDVLNNGSAQLVTGSYLNQVGNNPYVGGTDQTTTNGLNPRPQFSVLVDDVAYDACGVPPSIEPVEYIGAFDPDTDNWTAGWTAMSLRGILAD